jgi:hypothetical protein
VNKNRDFYCFLLLRFVFCLVIGCAIFSAQSVSASDELRQAVIGKWQLNDRLSDSVEKKFRAFEEPIRGGFRDGGIGSGRNRNLGRATGDPSALEIEFQADDPDRIARTSKMRKVVSATSVHIGGVEELLVVYDDEIKRKLVPNPHGRIFSASGDELIADRFGHTLSFWQKHVLVVETKTRGGVNVVERYRYDRRISKLRVSTSVTPSGRAGIEFERVYDRADDKT